MNLTKLLLGLTNLPIYLAALYALVRFIQFPKELRAISYFIFYSALIQTVSLMLWYFHINNMFLLHLYINIGLGLLAWFYITVLVDYLNKKLILLAVALFWLASLIDLIINDRLAKFNSLFLTIESILVIIISLFTFSFILNKDIKVIKQKLYSSVMWINSGLFIYYTANVLLFYFGQYIMTAAFGASAAINIWLMHSVFTVIMYSCFIVGLWRWNRT
jgi:hypothetical protein